MNLLQHLVLQLPESWQEQGGDWLLRAGLLRRIPGLAGLLRTLEVMGGDPLEIQRVLPRASCSGDPFRDAWTDLGLEVARAAEKTDDPARSRGRYHRAGLYLLVASAVSALEAGARERYRLAIRVFDRYRALQDPATEKVLLDLEEMSVSGYLQPARKRRAPTSTFWSGVPGRRTQESASSV